MNIDHSEGYLKPCTCNECNEHLDATKKSVTSSNESQSPIVDASIEDIYRLYLDYAKDNDSPNDDKKVSEDSDATNVDSTTTTSRRVYGPTQKVWIGETTWRYCSHGPLTPCNSPPSSRHTSPRRSPTPPMRTTSPTQPRRARSTAQTPTTTTRSTTNNDI